MRASEHERRCQPYLLRLRMLAGGRADAMLPWQVTAEVRDATNAVVAEAAAAGQVSLAATHGGRGASGAETFLSVRLARLARSADEAVAAARSGDVPGLRRHLARFNALATAIWAVQEAVQVPAPAAPAPPAVAYPPATHYPVV